MDRKNDDSNGGLGKRKNKGSKLPDHHDFLYHGRIMWRRSFKKRSAQSELRDFIAYFGCSPFTCASLWALMVRTGNVPHGGSMHKLLWTLLFFKTYSKESVLCTLSGCKDPKTFRNTVWDFLHHISYLEPEVVSLIYLFV